MSGYITAIKTLEITAEINWAIKHPPEIPPGYGARLKTDATWEVYELPPKPEPNDADELTETEELTLLIGGAT